jgi:hypothetical protein
VVVIASACFSPQPLRDCHRIYARRFPPLLFVTTPVEIPVVNPAQRHDELIARPPTKRARLPKSKMMGIGRAPPADQARLRTDEFSMRLVAFANEFRKWRWRFGTHNCSPLGDTRGRPILGG